MAGSPESALKAGGRFLALAEKALATGDHAARDRFIRLAYAAFGIQYEEAAEAD
jgi:hypothetical protein